jgi:hypothetical protein
MAVPNKERPRPFLLMGKLVCCILAVTRSLQLPAAAPCQAARGSREDRQQGRRWLVKATPNRRVVSPIRPWLVATRLAKVVGGRAGLLIPFQYVI